MSRTAIITGAARGIGAAIARRFAEDDWRCVLVDLNPNVTDVPTGVLAMSPDSVGVIADVGTDEGISAVMAHLPPGQSRIALVNNAGITRDSTLAKMDLQQFTSVVQVNLGGPVRLSEAVVPFMSDGSVIVNLSSKSASGNFGQFNYAISKAGLIGLTKSLALQLAPSIRVNAVAPAFIATEMTDAIPEDLRQQFISRIPLGRAGDPSEVADVILWLASDQSSYVTGQVLAVCGGRSFGPNSQPSPRG
jgi:NAD(P)-dependent dehydrogenase (short-subunit alcohol dehydrogenase family)